MPVEKKTLFQTLKHDLFLRFRSFGMQSQANFLIQNLSMLIGAGMGVTMALQSVYAETNSPRMRSALKEIMDKVDNGIQLSRAIREARIVSPHTLSLIELGEVSGRLSENLQVAALQNEKEAVFRSRVRSALMYSIFVFMIAFVVGAGTSWFILPKIADFFADIEGQLPFLTRVLIDTGAFLEAYGFIFIPLVVMFFVMLFYFLFSFPKTKFIGHTILFHIPLIKDLIQETEIARFGFLAGTMVRAGMPINTVFELMPETTTFLNYKRFYMYMHDRVVEGYTFRKAFASYKKIDKIMPIAVRQMIIAAEQSGTLSESLIKIGELYESRVDATSRNIPTFLEPALLLVIGGMVGILALGVLLPIYQLGTYF